MLQCVPRRTANPGQFLTVVFFADGVVQVMAHEEARMPDHPPRKVEVTTNGGRPAIKLTGNPGDVLTVILTVPEAVAVVDGLLKFLEVRGVDCEAIREAAK